MSSDDGFLAYINRHDLNDIVGEVVFPTKIPRVWVEHMFTTALEGGINYWCPKVDLAGKWQEGLRYLADHLSYGHTIIIFEDEDGTGDPETWKRHELTLEKWLKGLKMWCEHIDRTPQNVYDKHDIEHADAIVQFALFGEIVYG